MKARILFRFALVILFISIYCLDITEGGQIKAKTNAKKASSSNKLTPANSGGGGIEARRNSFARQGLKPNARFEVPGNKGLQMKVYYQKGNIAKPPNNYIHSQTKNTINQAKTSSNGHLDVKPGTTIFKGEKDGVRLDSQPNVGSGPKRHGSDRGDYANLQIQQNDKQRGKPGQSTTYSGLYAPKSFVHDSNRAAWGLDKSYTRQEMVNVRLSPPSSPLRKYNFETYK